MNKRLICIILALVLLLLSACTAQLPAETESGSTAETQTEDQTMAKKEEKAPTSVRFGSYPQSEVTDEAMKANLTRKAGDLPTADNSKGWTSYQYFIEGTQEDYMWFIDVENGGERYRGVYFTKYRPYYTTNISSAETGKQDDNGYKTATVYWFRYEPLTWRILNTADGKALILCEKIIDSQHFYRNSKSRTIDGHTVYANNYAQSDIRIWLNNSFYQTAFAEAEREKILLTAVDNSERSADTEDYVSLLSLREATKENAGFCADESAYDPARQMKVTDYARIQGIYAHNDGEYGGTYDENGWWWLRSPSPHSFEQYNGCAVCHFGFVDQVIVTGTNHGVVPAMQIRNTVLS